MLFNQVNINIGRAFSVVVSPDGKNVYVPVSGRIIYWIRDVDTGELTNEVKLINNDLDGASDVAVSPNGKNVYLLATNSLIYWDRNTDTHLLIIHTWSHPNSTNQRHMNI